MPTLQDFLMHVKKTEYVLAEVVLIAFLIFWFMLWKRRSKAKSAEKAAPIPAQKTLRVEQMEVRTADGLFFGKGHAWAHLEQSGIMRIGIDDLISKVVGAVDRIDVSPLKSVIRHGGTAFSIFSSGKKLDIHLPFEGEVREINQELLKHPETVHSDPYRAGWILKVKPAKLTEALKFMKVAEDAASWMKNELTRMQNFFVNNNGQIGGGALHKLNEAGWKKFQKEFLEEL